MAQMYDNQDNEVTVVQQGELKKTLHDLEFAGTGQKYAFNQVPTGKKWLIKAYQITFYGTATIADTFLRLKESDDTEIFSLAQLTAGTNYITQMGEQQLILEAGTKIGAQCNVTADTDGHLQFTALYIEMDA